MMSGTEWKASAVREDEGVPSVVLGVEDGEQTPINKHGKSRPEQVCEVMSSVKGLSQMSASRGERSGSAGPVRAEDDGLRTQGVENKRRTSHVEPTSSGARGKPAVGKSAAREGEEALSRGS